MSFFLLFANYERIQNTLMTLDETEENECDGETITQILKRREKNETDSLFSKINTFYDVTPATDDYEFQYFFSFLRFFFFSFVHT